MASGLCSHRDCARVMSVNTIVTTPSGYRKRLAPLSINPVPRKDSKNIINLLFVF